MSDTQTAPLTEAQIEHLADEHSAMADTYYGNRKCGWHLRTAEAIRQQRGEIAKLRGLVGELVYYAYRVTDEGPHYEGWKSAELLDLIGRAENAEKPPAPSLEPAAIQRDR